MQSFSGWTSIAVVEFDQPVEGDNIAPIPMALGGSDHTGNEDCWIMGWGRGSSSGKDIFHGGDKGG